MTTRSSGFTLIELLVVVAILGIISAIGIVSYNGYVGASKKKSAENIMMQISLAQSEYYSDNDNYFFTKTCSITGKSDPSNEIEKGFNELLILFEQNPIWNEEAAKKKLLEFFDLLGFNDPNVMDARKKLSSMMFK